MRRLRRPPLAHAHLIGASMAAVLVCVADRLTGRRRKLRLVCMTNQLENGATADLRRAAAVAADYEQLQGLITATVGAGLLVWAFGSNTWGAVTIALGTGVWSSYYQKRYGKAVTRRSVLLAVLWALVGLVVCWAGWIVDQMAGLPVLVLPLLGAVCLLALYRGYYHHVGVTPVHWAALAFVALGTLARPAGLDLLGPDTGLAFLGVGLVAVGLADHARLVRSMKPVPRD